MESIIKELWHGNIIPQEDSRTNSKEMKELLGYMSRHHEDLEKSFTDEQKEIFEKFHACWSEYLTKFALWASEVISDSEVHFVSEVSPDGEVMGKLNFT